MMNSKRSGNEEKPLAAPPAALYTQGIFRTRVPSSSSVSAVSAVSAEAYTHVPKGGCSIERCQSFLESIESFPKIKLLLDNMAGSRPKIECRPCTETGPEGAARAALFNDTPATLVLCTNRLPAHELEEAVTHELVHAFDYSHNRCNFYECDGLAYTEVRAAREAECGGTKYFPFQFLKDMCVKEHATRSTNNIYGRGSDEVSKQTVCVCVYVCGCGGRRVFMRILILYAGDV